MARKEVVVLNLSVVVRRSGDGPTQQADAIREAALEQLDSFTLEVDEEGNSREAAVYEVTVASAKIASLAETREAFVKLGLSTRGEIMPSGSSA